MNGKLFPCSEWARQLTVLHEEDLSHSDFVALQAHLDSCPTCNTIRGEYLALADALAQDVSYDLPAEIPPKLQHRLQKKSEYMEIPIEDTEKENSWERVVNGFVTSEFDETLYREVHFFLGIQKPFEEDHRPHT